MTSLFYITMVLFIAVCVILVLLILIQKGRGGGLASAFGGAGGQTAFGSKTGDVLTWATSIVFAVFVVLAVCLNLVANHIDAARGGTANLPITTSQPVMPGTPNSSLPSAPRGDPGIANPPTVPSALPTTLPAVQTMSASSMPHVPTTMPASVQHEIERVPVRIPAATTLPTTAP